MLMSAFITSSMDACEVNEMMTKYNDLFKNIEVYPRHVMLPTFTSHTYMFIHLWCTQYQYNIIEHVCSWH